MPMIGQCNAHWDPPPPRDIFWNISFHPNQFWFDSEFWSEIKQIAILMPISNLYSKVFRIRYFFIKVSTVQYPRKKSLPVFLFLRLLFIQERKLEFPSLPQGGTVRPCWEGQSILSASNRSIIQPDNFLSDPTLIIVFVQFCQKQTHFSHFSKGCHPPRKVQFFWTLFKRPLTPPPLFEHLSYFAGGVF